MRSIQNALVLGGSGFFGSWLVEALTLEGIETTVVDRHASVARGGPETVCADVVDTDLSALVRDRAIDAVFHLAGSASVPRSVKQPIDDVEGNTVLTLSVLEHARQVPNPPLVVFVSSAAVYGDAVELPMTEDHPLRPVSPYGISKLAAEHYVRLYAELYAIPTLSVRPFSLYGPRQRKQVVYDLLTRAISGERPLRVLGSPQVSRDLVYIEDAAAALVSIARGAPAQGEAYNLASGRETTLGELASTLIEASGADTVAEFTGVVRPGDPLRWVGDPRKAEAVGARCDTGLNIGLRRTAEWLMETGGDVPATAARLAGPR